ncbi:hypothetical protein MMC21_004032 [Puttea exsequens]|nr:hypothetical protein [Puttea exsequens]
MDLKFHHQTLAGVGAEITRQSQLRRTKEATYLRQEGTDAEHRVRDRSATQSPIECIQSSISSSLSCPSSPGSLHGSISKFQEPAFTGQKNKGGRPRVRQPPTCPPSKQYLVRTKLRSDRPVLAELPIEIWQTVMSFCPPAFLLKARSVNLTFYRILTEQGSASLWRLARQRHFGTDQPEPPPGVSERQYADLLTGLGCQSCKDKRARRTYWAYQRRWCERCLQNNTEREKGALSLAATMPTFRFQTRESSDMWHHLYPVISQFHIADLVPNARFDSWGHYQWAGSYGDDGPPWGKIYPTGQQIALERKARANLSAEVEEILAYNYMQDDQTSNDLEQLSEPLEVPKQIAKRLEEWLNVKLEKTNCLMTHLQAIENWCEETRLQKWDTMAELRHDRALYFQKMAGEMRPPLSYEALQLCPAYQRASVLPKSPTERSWRLLERKLYIEREDAEKRVQTKYRQERIRDVRNHRQKLLADFEDNLLGLPQDTIRPEQRFVLALADIIIAKLMASKAKIAKIDLVHILLQRIYDEYQVCDNKPIGACGQYRLLLNDARIVCKSKIYPILEIEDKDSDGSTTAMAKLVKCPGCPDSTHPTRSPLMPFDNLIAHIQDSHRHDNDLAFFCIEPGPSDEPHRMLPYLCLEWPKNLPILAPHHRSTGRWDPEDRGEYHYSPNFHSNSNDFSSGATMPLPYEFVQSLCYAALKLDGTRDLDRETKATVVLEWARSKYEQWSKGRGVEVKFLEIVHLALEICQRYCDIKALFDKLHCGICDGAQGKRIATSTLTFGELKDHYVQEHANHIHSWAHSMFDFADNFSLITLAIRLQSLSASDVYTIRELFPTL